MASRCGEVHRQGTRTQADGWFASPAAICFAGTVLGAALEGEAFLAGIDECVAHGGQVQRPDVGMAWCLRLLAVVGWMRGKTLLGRGRLGLQEASPHAPVSQWNSPILSLMGPSHGQHPLPHPHPPALMSMQVVKMEITWIMTQLTLREPRHFSRGKGSNYKQKPEIFHPEGGPCHCWYLQPWESSFFFFAKAEELPSNTRKAFVQKYLLGGAGPKG